ncbi:MAG: ABC transporter ATP-binding protein [Alphaproteobacteria bacterium]|nr:ABC transporter ATP-binding protein [Alphaproteobacteria bacterium]
MRGQDVVLSQVSMTFPNGFTAVQPMDLTIRAGEFFSILGPSGCGKTTILRMISGFLDTSTGSVRIGGEEMTGIGPNKRPTALIFQNLALFPLMTVWENVAFGLEARGVAKDARRRRAEELLDLVALKGQEDKKPTELSGGQRQRVAVARALAVEPAVLLLDEPLSALDLKLRQHMRAELKAIQRKTGVTFIYITHDQGEALTMSDRVAVMNEGRLEQVGTGDEIYNAPASPFVATFVGEQNRVPGQVAEVEAGYARIDTPFGPMRGRRTEALSVGDQVTLFFRPERATITDQPADAMNVIDGTVARRDLEGPFINLFLKADDRTFAVHLTNAGDAGRDLDGAQKIAFSCADALIMADGAVAKEAAQ